MAQTTYQVTLFIDGKNTVGITSDDPAAAKAALDWAKEIHDRVAGYSAKQDEDKPEVQNEDEVPLCAVHQVPMVKQKGKYGSFWSCHQRNADRSFCSYRPNGN